MVSKEFEKLKEALKKPATLESMREAAKAMKEYQVAKLARGEGSRPTIVSLGLKKYPNAVPLDKAAEEIARNPDFYNLMKRIVTKERG